MLHSIQPLSWLVCRKKWPHRIRRTSLLADYGFHQSTATAPLLLPIPPGKSARATSSQVDDCRATEAARARPAEDRWKALHNFRRAKGLCQFNAEKWSKDHRCADTVQLHAQ